MDQNIRNYLSSFKCWHQKNSMVIFPVKKPKWHAKLNTNSKKLCTINGVGNKLKNLERFSKGCLQENVFDKN